MELFPLSFSTQSLPVVVSWLFAKKTCDEVEKTEEWQTKLP
jgi:hypothetical protein